MGDLKRRPPPGPISDPSAFDCDAIIDLNEGDDLAWHAGFGQRHLRLDHTSRVRRSNHGKSHSSTSITS